MICRGHETWHPDPEFYYKHGGGPMFDMGPYYLTAMINLLGGVSDVSAMTKKSFAQRTITSKPHGGEIIDVDVDTYIAGTMRFRSGAIGTLFTTFDAYYPYQARLEVYGSEGTLFVPDPNCFGGEVRLFQPHLAEWAKLKLTHGYTDNMRGIGAADLARSLSGGVPARACGELAFHVLDVMCGISDSARTGAFVKVQSTCERPAPLPVGLRHGQLELEA